MKSKKGLIITGSIILVLIIGAVIITLFMRNKNEENYLEWKFESTYDSWGENDREVVDGSTFSGTVISTKWWRIKSEEGEELELKHMSVYHYENGVKKNSFWYIEEYKGTLNALPSDDELKYMLDSYEINTWIDLTSDPNYTISNTEKLYREKSITDECESLTDLECYETYYTNGHERLPYSWSDNNIISDEFIEPKDVVVIN